MRYIRDSEELRLRIPSGAGPPSGGSYEMEASPGAAGSAKAATAWLEGEVDEWMTMLGGKGISNLPSGSKTDEPVSTSRKSPIGRRSAGREAGDLPWAARGVSERRASHDGPCRLVRRKPDPAPAGSISKTSNKARGLPSHPSGWLGPEGKHQHSGRTDAFVHHLSYCAPVVLAQMAAGSGQVTYDWFHRMYLDVAGAGIVFTTVGVVTSDPASVGKRPRLGSQTARTGRLPGGRKLDYPGFGFHPHRERKRTGSTRFREALSPAGDPVRLPPGR